MDKLLNTIIVDDSRLQRAPLVKLIKDHEDLVLKGAYKNAVEARNALKAEEIHLIFLDVEMPVINGFDFINSLENCPQIILTTVSPDYALKAFDHDVTDYLLKPVSTARFKTAVKKAVSNHLDRRLDVAEETHIFVNSNFKKIKVVVKDIKWVEGLGDYIKIDTLTDSILVLSTMKSFIEKLPEEKFLRVHKSYIINLDRVQRFNSSQVEIHGQTLPVSRHKKEALEEALTS
ncbi:MAG: LytR/AlgR family response regulator transcription factor [Flavobacteriaceae bacterium]